VERQRNLLTVLSSAADEKRYYALAELLDGAVAAVNRRDSLRALISNHLDLLALNATQHAGKTGEHYAAANRSQYWSIVRAALGAGIIIPIMALAKTQILRLHAPILYETMLVSLNYGLGFVLIHLLHFTVATKQPAMTAAHIAEAVTTKAGRLSDVPVLVELIQRVTRTQFAAILGNVCMALPLAYLITVLYTQYAGGLPYSTEKAEHLFHDLNPTTTLAVLHAGIAGVCLFLSGLISGIYDNVTAYGRVGERLRRHGLLKFLLNDVRRERFADYVESNLGALAGNFVFGCLLGMMPFIGVMTGLPLDIRHIAFSAANFSYGLGGMPVPPPTREIWLALAGVALIGFMNLAVSFSLALWFAFRSRHAHFARSSLKVSPLLLRRLFFSPLSFVMPPADAPTRPAAPVSGAGAESGP
jgi:site-specific recombinase